MIELQQGRSMDPVVRNKNLSDDVTAMISSTPSDETIVMPKPSIKDPCYVNAMVHFYRGELGRIMIWRQRLDITTNWAITTTTTIVSVSFGFREMPHLIFFFNLVIVLAMLWMEARRYRFYDAFRVRVRLLEAHFMTSMISQTEKQLQGRWREELCEDLLIPTFKMTRWEAIGRRLKRNYAFIIAVILIAWTIKIFMHAKEPITTPALFYRAMGIGHLPAWLTACTFLMTILGSAFLILYATKKRISEEGDFSNYVRNPEA